MGLEITTSYVSTTNCVYYLVATGETVSEQSQLPAYLIFDRIYVHGLSTTNTQHGIGMDAQSVGIVDSYCDGIHHNGADSQCFFAYNGSGPFLIQNNFIQAAGENIMFGGADPSITNLVPSDITIVGNLVQKDLAWRRQAAPYNWVVKNLFELKNAQRLLLDGNVFRDTWAAGQSVALIMRSVNQSGACPQCVVQDITVTHNIIQHAPLGIALAAYNAPYIAVPTGRVLIQNNLFNDISSTNWGGRGWLFQLSSDPTFIPHDWIIDHNTGFEDQSGAYLGDRGTINNLQFTNNIFNYGSAGIRGNGVGSALEALKTFASGYTYNDMVFINSTRNAMGTFPARTHWNTVTGVEFTTISGTSPNYSGNFQLTNSSPYYHAGTDGKDIGLWDWNCLNNDSTAAVAGKFVPGPGCALSGDLLLPQPPTELSFEVH
jgi:hypothetical protein